ncbi:hypothetical protein TCSYLVIO_004083 [Trypanosoma cruzi]|nr:hypothetical protein TCSYLVIO_004083 [Trypanosoma cruzi]
MAPLVQAQARQKYVQERGKLPGDKRLLPIAAVHAAKTSGGILRVIATPTPIIMKAALTCRPVSHPSRCVHAQNILTTHTRGRIGDAATLQPVFARTRSISHTCRAGVLSGRPSPRRGIFYPTPSTGFWPPREQSLRSRSQLRPCGWTVGLPARGPSKKACLMKCCFPAHAAATAARLYLNVRHPFSPAASVPTQLPPPAPQAGKRHGQKMPLTDPALQPSDGGCGLPAWGRLSGSGAVKAASSPLQVSHRAR